LPRCVHWLSSARCAIDFHRAEYKLANPACHDGF
jgi:hypothetical protein